MPDEFSKNESAPALDKPDYARAIDACLRHANEHYGLTIGEVIERMGSGNRWTVYKQLEDGRIPVRDVVAFEEICHARFITRYLAEKGGFVLTARPDGSRCQATDLISLQHATAEASARLAAHEIGKGNKREALTAINAAMEALSWHKTRLLDGA